MNEVLSGKGKADESRGYRHRLILAAVVSLLGIGANVGAFDIPTGSEDVSLRWDNTFRYSMSGRVAKQDKAIIGNPNYDDGDRNFNTGIVSARLDVLSEADLIYKKNYGVRLSGAAWYDPSYDNLKNSSVATSNHLENGKPANGLNSNEKKYALGPGGELLDAFIFGKTDIGGVPLSVKVGRHTIFWGEGLLLGGAIHGISYSQMPLDLAKGTAIPGSEAKELFLPQNNVSFQVQPSETLTIAGQYFLEWDPTRLPEPGTYFGAPDVALAGGEGSLIAGYDPTIGYLRLVRGSDIKPNKRDWGLSTRWTPEWLEGTVGLYYRNFSDKLPQAHLMLGPVDPSTGIMGSYHAAYADNIDMYGISLSKSVLGVSVGAELSYRQNMPLISEAPVITLLPGKGQTDGTRGDTMHAVVNFLGLIKKTPLFDAASWNMEYVWNHVNRVSQGEAYYKGRDGYNEIDKVSKDYFGGAVGFTPTWFQVLSGVDLSMPLSISSGLSGNSAVTAGGNKHAGSYSAGFSADIFSKYKADLNYIGFFGDHSTDATGAVKVANGIQSVYTDRNMITLTLKATF